MRVKLEGGAVQYMQWQHLLQLGNTCTSLLHRWVGLRNHASTRTARAPLIGPLIGPPIGPTS